MKNNLIENEVEEFEEKNIPIKVPINANSNNLNRNNDYINNNYENYDNNLYNKNEIKQIDYSDELNKSKFFNF